jgi:hypothetical protein
MELELELEETAGAEADSEAEQSAADDVTSRHVTPSSFRAAIDNIVQTNHTYSTLRCPHA